MRLIILSFLVFLTTACNNSEESIEKYTILKNGNIIPIHTDTILKGKNIILKNDQIIAIVDKIDPKFLHNENQIIDCSGKFIIPGLFDSHFHYGRNKKLYSLSDSLLLKFGITNVLSLHGSKELMSHKIRIDNKLVIGPQITTTGRNQDNELSKEEAIEKIKEHKKYGFKFIKVYSNIPRKSFLFINEFANENNLRLVGHIPRDIGFFDLMESNLELIVHAEEFLYNEPVNYLMGIDKATEPDYEMTDTIASILKKYNKWVSPTLVSFQSILSQSKKQEHGLDVEGEESLEKIANYWNWIPPDNTIPSKFNTKGKIYRLEKGLKFQMLLVKSLYKKEVKMLAGTDSPAYWNLVPGKSLHQELELIVKCGVPEYEVLRTATINPATFLGVSDNYGTVEVDKVANLIILNQNPIEDIKNTLDIEYVVKAGKIVRRKK